MTPSSKTPPGPAAGAVALRDSTLKVWVPLPTTPPSTQWFVSQSSVIYKVLKRLPATEQVSKISYFIGSVQPQQKPPLGRPHDGTALDTKVRWRLALWCVLRPL